jgi:hypothetical protein
MTSTSFLVFTPCIFDAKFVLICYIYILYSLISLGNVEVNGGTNTHGDMDAQFVKDTNDLLI